MSWLQKISQSLPAKLYHRGIPGLTVLKPNQSGGLTSAGLWAAEFYDVWPIFLSFDPNVFHRNTHLQLYAIDSSKLQPVLLVSDLPSLVDKGMYIEPDDGIGWWKHNEPPQLSPYLEDGQIEFSELVKMWEVCSQITQTVGYQGEIAL